MSQCKKPYECSPLCLLHNTFYYLILDQYKRFLGDLSFEMQNRMLEIDPGLKLNMTCSSPYNPLMKFFTSLAVVWMLFPSNFSYFLML